METGRTYYNAFLLTDPSIPAECILFLYNICIHSVKNVSKHWMKIKKQIFVNIISFCHCNLFLNMNDGKLTKYCDYKSLSSIMRSTVMTCDILFQMNYCCIRNLSALNNWKYSAATTPNGLNIINWGHWDISNFI